MTIAEAVTMARSHLAAGPHPAPASDLHREARRLVCLATGWSEVTLLAHPERPLSQEAEAGLLRLAGRRAQGEPYAYLSGAKEFAALQLNVDARVLVPRPETEHLVAAAVEVLEDFPTPRILDLGVGSGAVALALAAALPQAKLVAVDLDLGAAAVAAGNASRLGLADRVDVIVGDWADAVEPGSFDLVVSNPPYIAVDDPEVEPGVHAFEPALALWGGSSGLEAIARLLASLERGRCTAPLLCEIGGRQRGALAELAPSFRRRLQRVDADLAGWPRVAHLYPSKTDRER